MACSWLQSRPVAAGGLRWLCGLHFFTSGRFAESVSFFGQAPGKPPPDWRVPQLPDGR
jgi:hypothetical protein